MILRAAKNQNGVIVVIGSDEGQSGSYNEVAKWCTWTIEDIACPILEDIEDADPTALRFKENDSEDGIDVRSEEEVLSDPHGTGEEVSEEE